MAYIEMIGGPLDGQKLKDSEIPKSYCLEENNRAFHWSLVTRDMLVFREAYMVRFNLTAKEYDKFLALCEEAWADLKKRFDEPKAS